MDALVKDAVVRVFLIAPCGIDDDRPCGDSDFLDLCYFPIFRRYLSCDNLQLSLREKYDALGGMLVPHLQIHDLQSQRGCQLFPDSPLRIHHRVRHVFVQQPLGDRFHLLIRYVGDQERAQSDAPAPVRRVPLVVDLFGLALQPVVKVSGHRDDSLPFRASLSGPLLQLHVHVDMEEFPLDPPLLEVGEIAYLPGDLPRFEPESGHRLQLPVIQPILQIPI